MIVYRKLCIENSLVFFFVFISFISFSQERLVKANGHNFNVYLNGFENRKPDTPAIIFENGMGVDLGNWDTIIEQISKFSPVLAYDRASVGKSEKVFQMPTVKVVAENLRAILHTLDIPPPYILVGHSMGGVYIRSYAGFYPNEIAGLVFIDPADFTETKNDWNDIFRKMNVPEKKIDEMLYNRLYQQNPKVDSLNFGPWSETQVLTDLRRTDFAQIAKLPLPSVPIYFFVGGKFEVPVERRSKDLDQESFFHIKNNSNMERWKKLIYSSNKGGVLIYLTNAGHYIQRDEPKSVISNIKVLVESLKN